MRQALADHFRLQMMVSSQVAEAAGACRAWS